MKIRRAFYITPWNKPLNVAISVFTLSRFSHEEIGFQLGSKWQYFSSTNRDGAKGTRWIEEDDLFKNPERWKVIEYDVSQYDLKAKINRANAIKDLPYDWTGVFGKILIFHNIHKLEEWYCCEACDYVDTGITRKSNPGSDYRRVRKLYDCKDIDIVEEMAKKDKDQANV